MTLNYDQGLRMAKHMQDRGEEIKQAIEKVTKAGYGVVALRFTDDGKFMEIEVLKEPYEPNVRVYPG